jgi:hypothetical protein
MIATVKVKHGKDYMVINASEFDPEKHQEWTDVAAIAPTQDEPTAELPLPAPRTTRRSKAAPTES